MGRGKIKSLVDLVDDAALQQLLEVVVEEVQELGPLLEGEGGRYGGVVLNLEGDQTLVAVLPPVGDKEQETGGVQDLLVGN